MEDKNKDSGVYTFNYKDYDTSESPVSENNFGEILRKAFNDGYNQAIIDVKEALLKVKSPI